MGFIKSFGQMRADERFSAMMNGKTPDRLPVIEWAPFWPLTVDRWNADGLNFSFRPGCKLNLELQRKMGLDGCIQTFFRPRSQFTPKPAYHGAGVMRSEKDYEEIKSTLFCSPEIFCPPEHIDWLKETRGQGDTIHWFTVEGFFWFPRTLFGIEPHLYSFYDEPELLLKLCSDYTDWLKTVFEYIGNTFIFDYMSFAEDMSYNNGPMLSKDLFDEFLAPFYKKVIPLIKKLNIPVFIDSDGDITKAVDWYASVGADGMFPLERQAGVDVSLYIKKQPHMFFLGHFDKMCMKFGEKAMRAEFERLLPSMKTGKLIPSVDHQTPPDVSVENYRIYVKLLKEYAACVK